MSWFWYPSHILEFIFTLFRNKTKNISPTDRPGYSFWYSQVRTSIKTLFARPLPTTLNHPTQKFYWHFSKMKPFCPIFIRKIAILSLFSSERNVMSPDRTACPELRFSYLKHLESYVHSCQTLMVLSFMPNINRINYFKPRKRDMGFLTQSSSQK